MIYSYITYPFALFVLSKICNNPWNQKNLEPTVSVIISVYNEEAVISEKVSNTLNLDYPQKLLEVIVGSDGSTDRTNEIVSGIGDSRVVFYTFPERQGKTICLNKLVPLAKGEILIFTDANSILPASVLRKIVRNFSDHKIGLVTGWTKYISHSGEESNMGLYSHFEKVIKVFESAVGSCVGADGAIFAIRKSLYRNLQGDDINDFITPFDVIRQQQRVVLDPDVFCVEEESNEAKNAFRRQVRITTRTLWAIRRNMELLNPFKYGSFSFFIYSHKVMRFLAPLFLMGMFAINLFLFKMNLLFKASLLLQSLFFACGTAGLLFDSDSAIFDIPEMLLVTFIAQIIGWLRMLAGIEDIMWTPSR
jgi:cellulose synthase/poly-beta-1,6-N-acetylglucosamine synthase-like glycosyltransferase